MMKLPWYRLATCLVVLGFAVSQLTSEAFSAQVTTCPMHKPIYPAPTDLVEYKLEVPEAGAVESVELWETVYSVNSNGDLTPLPGYPRSLGTWDSVPVTFQKRSGYPANTFIEYEFQVVDSDQDDHFHKVGYAIRDYPPSLSPAQGGSYQPAPVYVQLAVDLAMDIIFIPDTDLPLDSEQRMGEFRAHCHDMICEEDRDGLLDDIVSDDITRPLSRFFNFYINPLPGTAKNYQFPPVLHEKPVNWSQLTFAEAHAIMHWGELRDYTLGTLFSTELQNRGTMLHEVGHALFGLADEYAYGSHWEADFYQNIWFKRKKAKQDAPLRHKTK